METKCPFCDEVFKIPKEYFGDFVICPFCKQSFKATRIQKHLPPEQKENVFVRLWNNSPTAYRTGFLATLGVISAVFFVYYFTGFLKRAKPPHPPPPKNISLDYQSTSRGTGDDLRLLCTTLGSLQMAASLKTVSLSDGTRSHMISNLDYGIKLLNFSKMDTPLKKAKSVLIDAIKAEIDVLQFENKSSNKDAFLLKNKNYMRLLNRSMGLRGEAWAGINRLMNKI